MIFIKLETKRLILRKPKAKDIDDFVIDVDGSAVGMIGLFEIIPKLKAKTGYFIGKKYRGKGITTKMIKEITKYGFKKYKLKRIFAHVNVENKASAKVLEKSGFILEGIEKKNWVKHGKYHDQFLYAKIKR